MNLASAFALSRQRYLAFMAIAAVAILAGCSMISSSGPTGGRIVWQIENDPGALPINSREPRAIYPLRIVSDPDGDEMPAAHYFNMMRASSNLLAGRFAIKDKGVLSLGKAEASEPTKLVQFAGQLFFPLVTLEGVISRPN